MCETRAPTSVSGSLSAVSYWAKGRGGGEGAGEDEDIVDEE